MKDLLPLYIDKLTTEVTNSAIEEHISTCPACNEVMESMEKNESGVLSPAEASGEKKKIDFLKKIKFRSRIRILVLSVALAALVLFLGISLVRMYFVGDKDEEGSVTYDIEVVGNDVYVTATAVTSNEAISKLNIEEGEDSLKISCRTVKSSPFASREKKAVYRWKSSEPLRLITAGETGRIVWMEDEPIYDRTWDVWSTKHMYVGDMPANARTAKALLLSEKIGLFTNELQTAEEPYGWTILFSEPLDASYEKYYLSEMRKAGYEMIALVQNLDHVTFRYTIDGEELEDTYFAEDASKGFGQDVKNCWTSVKLFQNYVHWLDTSD